MQRSVMQRCRSTTLKSWVAVALTLWLLLAESFAIAHQYDSAAHAAGQDCEVCVGAASFGAGAPAAPFVFVPAASPAVLAAAAVLLVFVSAVPARRYARGPPVRSFTF